ALRLTPVHDVERRHRLHVRGRLADEFAHRGQIVLGHIPPDFLGQVQQRHDGRSLLGVARQDSLHLVPAIAAPIDGHRSTSPSTGSTLAIMATMSAMSSPRIMVGMAKTW